mmetsp:Transcript_30872/g.95520  ORF Transcript_30872/g.95520 Transcript_30872/m.95520 type:complete len:276 (-) Transcript_30872:379-1206(-)
MLPFLSSWTTTPMWRRKSSQGIDWTHAVPGPVTVVLQQPSPLQQQAPKEPTGRTQSFASWYATRLYESTTSVSPAASVFRSTVPVAWMNAVPWPVSLLIVCRQHPKPAQHNRSGFASHSKPGRPPPMLDMKAPRRAWMRSYCARSNARMSAGTDGVTPTYVGREPSFVYSMMAQASPPKQRAQQPIGQSQFASTLTPGPIYIMLPGSSMTVWPGWMPTERICICCPTTSQVPSLQTCSPSAACVATMDDPRGSRDTAAATIRAAAATSPRPRTIR